MNLKQLITGNLWRINIVVAKKFPKGMIRFMKSQGMKNIVGVEIGVDEGTNAKYAFKYLDIKKLYLIDPYNYSEEYKQGDKGKFTIDENAQKAKLIMLNKLKDFPIELYEITSDKAVSKFKDKSLDYVYIDGDHRYEQVKKDIENYYPKVKKGGVFGGHNFCDFRGVTDAVMEFALKSKLKLTVDTEDWYVIKGSEGKA